MIPLGPFLLGSPLGNGGMGAVWSGLHRDQGVPVAVKVLTGELAREPSFLGAFRNEVRAVAALDHPGIVRVFDFGQIGPETEARARGHLPAGSPYLVMELAGGGSLAPYCGRLPWRLARDVLFALLDALAHAHARGVVHRDLKPGNILCRHDAPGTGRYAGDEAWRPATAIGRSIVLTDWGLAHAIEREQSGRGDESISGTPAYMAPEQFEGRWRDTGPWTDLYALGCVAWALVAGHPPFGRPAPVHAMAAHLYAPLPPLEAKVSVPPAFEGWVRRLLEKDPAHRFRRAADAAWALSTLGDPPLPEAPGDLPREVTAEEDPSLTPVTVPLIDFLPSPVAPPAPPTPADLAVAAPSSPPPPVALPPFPAEWRELEEERAVVPQLVGAGLGLYGLRSLPLVDRDTERNLLWSALGVVRATGRPAVALLHGPSGCGKSRLAEWLCQRAHEVGTAGVLRATHSPSPGPSDGIVPMVARQLRCGGLGRAEIGLRLRQLLGAGTPEALEEAEALTELLAPAARGSPGLVRLESSAERYALVKRVLARLSAERPVVLWMDDVAFGADSLDFAAYLWEACEAHPLPILVVLTARDDVLAERAEEAERLERLVARASGIRLHVGPLPAPDHAALVRRLLGLDGELAARVEERTAGNPLFAVQLVGDWVQRGLLEPGLRGFRLRAGARVDIPDDMHAVWATRLERLLEGRPEEEGWALEVASLLGQEVDGAEWAVACTRAGANAPWGLVEALLGARLAVTDEDGPVLRWSFVHAMLRESLERRAREAGRLTRWHRACAEMLAQQGGPGVAERRARHLAASDAPEQSIDPWLVGVRERIDAGDYFGAERLLDEREEAMEGVGLPASDPRWGDGWLAGCAIATLRGLYDAALEYARQAEAAGARHGWARIRVRAILEQCQVLRNRGELVEAAQRLAEFGDLARDLDDPELEARHVLALGLLARDRGAADASARYLEEALARFLELASDRDAGLTCNALSSLHRKRGRLSEAARYAEEARRRFEACGYRLGVADALTNLGEIARLQGDHRVAEGRYRAALARSRAIGSGNAAFPLVNLGLVLLEQWRWDECLGPLEEGLRILAGQRRRPFVGAVHACLMACAAGRHDWTAFEAHLAEADAILAETGFVDLDVGRASRMAGDLCADAGKWEHARAALGIALTQWRALGLGEDEADVARQIAELPA